MKHRTLASGMTLIELLIVLSIMMTALSLVGGLALETLDKTRAQTEVISVYSLIKKASIRAFSSGSGVMLAFDNQNLNVFVEKELQTGKTFKYLDFPRQVILFNRNGLPNILQITVAVDGTETVLDFKTIFDANVSEPRLWADDVGG
ncbi:type II secretion system GspH family protein [Porticoccaceae bacterium]|nr:type II secretion system GspH family protein [Porticoccaceae bacterium]